jgi:hypothetical protein
MPDPRLVSRAQRAATMLERAWERWRDAHGLAAEPLPPVSSYVGYSIEEPWGRPRVVFGVAAEDAERLAAFLEDSLDLDGAGEAGDDGPWPAALGGAGAERGNLLEDVRGRIPVQGWPEFSESREQLNSSGAAGPGAGRPGFDGPWPPGARPGQAAADPAGPGQAGSGQAGPGQAGSGQAGPGQAGPGQAGRAEVPPGADAPGSADPPHPDNGLATVAGPAGADGPDGAGRPDGRRADGGPASRADTGMAEGDLRHDDDDAEHAAWLSGIRPGGAADDDEEYCDTADDLRATPHGVRPAQADAPGADTGRSGRNGAGGRHDTGDGETEPGEAPAAGAGPADTGVIGWPSTAGLTQAPRPPASQPRDDGPPASSDPAGGQPAAGPRPGRVDESQSGGPHSGGSHPGGPHSGAPGNPGSGGNGRPGDGPVDRPQDGPTATAADVPADLGNRTGLTDTMAAELAGWAAGELPGQASARLAAWASVGGAVARGRQQARRAGGSTAAERVR